MISIVIPIYNASLYLNQCLDSLLCQTDKDWEAILIDDGSSDNSAEICKQYAEKDKRFKVVTKKNEGVSKTRNEALSLCTGKYLLFLDADDFLFSDSCLQTLKYNILHYNADLVRFEYKAVNEKNVELFTSNNLAIRKKYYSIPVSAAEYCSKVIRNEYFLCLNLLRNDIVQKNKIRFLVNCRMREDAAFLLTYLSYCSSVVYLPNIYYAYRKHSGAVTAASDILTKYSKDLSLVFDSIYSIYKRNGDKSFKSYLEYFLSELTVDLRKSEYFKNRYEICKTFKNRALLYKCLSWGCVSNYIIFIISIIKRILIKLRVYGAFS